MAEEVLSSIREYSKSPSQQILEKIRNKLKTLKYSEIEKVLWDGLHSENGINHDIIPIILTEAQDPKHYKERTARQHRRYG